MIDGYDLDSITFHLNPHLVIDKVGKETMGQLEIPENEYTVKEYNGSIFQMEKIAGYFSVIFQNQGFLANLILKLYGLNVEIPKSEDGVLLQDNPLLISLIYLAYKTLAIATRHYPGYEEFGKLKISDLFLQVGDENYGLIFNNVKCLIEKIRMDRTHIGLKIRQTLKAIELFKSQRLPNGGFDYDTYSDLLQQKKPESLRDVLETMPPSYFVPVIKLKSGKKKGIEFDSLSSGQRQLIYTISTYIYHSLNILSVKGEDRLSYRNLCFILDEVEICFHPEYQRQFLKRMTDTINRLELNKEAHIHIIIATHSPFILSDIPRGNVLKLDEGFVCGKEETFAANIHDLLNDGFFLDYSIGEIAKEKIEELFRTAREGEEPQGKKIENFKFLCKHIGDEYLRNQAKGALCELLKRDELINRLHSIDRERAEILAELKRRNDEENPLQ